jgi:hypothetical protein
MYTSDITVSTTDAVVGYTGGAIKGSAADARVEAASRV